MDNSEQTAGMLLFEQLESINNLLGLFGYSSEYLTWEEIFKLKNDLSSFLESNEILKINSEFEKWILSENVIQFYDGFRTKCTGFNVLFNMEQLEIHYKNK